MPQSLRRALTAPVAPSKQPALTIVGNDASMIGLPARERATFERTRAPDATSNDLRQTLQLLTLVQAELTIALAGVHSQAVAARINAILATMSSTLGAMEENHRIDADVMSADVCDEQAIDPGTKNFCKCAAQRDKPTVRCGSPIAVATIFIVGDDSEHRSELHALLERDGRRILDFSDAEGFLAAFRPGGEACLLVDAYLPGIDGTALLRKIKSDGHFLPAIMMAGRSAIPIAVEAMKVGAIDFMEKPVTMALLRAAIDGALDLSRNATEAARHVGDLTARERQVMDLVLAGHPSKNIAADLCISQRTVETHRASMMRKTGAKSIPALARLALAAGAGASSA